MMRRPASPARGFTLLELLVAIGIFALFSALAYGGLLRMLETRDRLDAEREFWRTLSLTFAQIEDDLALARDRTVRDVYGNQLPALRGQPVDSRALGEPPLAFTRGGLFLLVTDTRPDLARVGYQLRDGALERLTWPDLDQAPTSKPRRAPLLEHVTELRLRYYTKSAGWVDVWQPTNNKELPAAVELTLDIEGRGQFQRVFRVNG
jgi:general secretion pathway protein J